MIRFVRSCALIVLFVCTARAEDLSPEAAAQLKQVESLVTHVQDLRKLGDALDFCRKVLKRHPENIDAHAYTCRLAWLLGVQLDDEDKAKELFRLGQEHARKLQKLYPERVEGYYWYAVNFGEFINRSSIFAKIGGMDEILDTAKKAMKIDPNYDFGGAYLIVGRINQLSPGGKDHIAYECFRSAIEVAPKRPTPHLYLGELLYADRKYEEALGEFRRVIDGPHEARYAVEKKLIEKKAEEWIKRTNEKLKRKTRTSKSAH